MSDSNIDKKCNWKLLEWPQPKHLRLIEKLEKLDEIEKQIIKLQEMIS